MDQTLGNAGVQFKKSMTTIASKPDAPRLASRRRLATLLAAPVLALLALAADADDAYSAAWGPALGSPLPVLEAPDHTGQPRTFENLKGPRGLLLFMNRSTDW